MKKFYFILIGIALLLAMSCSHDVNTTDTTDNSDNSSEPTINELLEKIPTSFKEFKDNFSSSRNVSRTAIALDASEKQAFSSTQYVDRTIDDASFISIFLILLKNDISTLNGFENDKNYNIPENFSFSEESLTEIETNFGFSSSNITMFTINTVKVVYEKPNVVIYMSVTFNQNNSSYPFLFLISGVYKDGKYEKMKAYNYQSVGLYNGSESEVFVHYYKEDNKIISIDCPSGNLNQQSICIVENEKYDYYDTNPRYTHKDTDYYVNYFQNEQFTYFIYDENGYLIAEIKQTNSSPATYEQVIPLYFINTNGKVITKEENSSTTSYYIDNNLTTNIASKRFGIQSTSGFNFRYFPCYIAHNSNPATIDLSTDGFNFTKTQIVSNYEIRDGMKVLEARLL